MRTVLHPACCWRTPSCGHFECGIFRHFGQISHLINRLLCWFNSKIIAKVQVISPATITIIIKAQVIVSISPHSFLKGIIFPILVTCVFRIFDRSFFMVITILSILLCCLSSLQILQSGFLDRQSWPVVRSHNWGWWLEEAPTLLAANRDLLQEPFHTSAIGLNGNLDPLSVFLQVVKLGTDVSKGHVATFFEHLDPFCSISQKQGIVVPSHNVLTHVGNLEHLPKLLRVPSEQVEKGESVEVLGSLVAHLHNLVIALAEGLATQLTPNISLGGPFSLLLLLKGEGTLHGRLNVAAGKRQTEACLWLTNKVQRNLRESLLLKVGDNGTATKA
mmetsp:Transcript_14255/g.29333  ORF Transcript_14255/g.29333 Transcript_14255/m.29333 type:complete len:332 (-) Transcript_14255:2006-3001(-)